ncbi:MAG: GldG family protein [Verrucomicrobiae bacterium]|nr:GldG family protein [Verrucomicrobiae bacterium]
MTPSAAPTAENRPAGLEKRAFERIRIAAQVGLQVVLMLVIFGQINYLSARRYQRWDLTQNRKFTLSDTTQKFLANLSADVRIVLASIRSYEQASDVAGLLDEYERFGGGRVSTELLDQSRDGQRLAILEDELGVKLPRNSLVILSRDRKKVLGAEELVVRDQSNGRVIEFRGERVLTSALLEVTEKQQKKIYLVAGKRKSEEIANINAQLAALLDAQNARLEPLNLESLGEIPDDADALLLAGNSQDLTARETAMVREFWEKRKGGLTILLDPAAPSDNVSALLREHGVRPEADRVLSVVSIPGMTARKLYDVPVVVLGETSLSREIAGLTTQLTGQTQSLTVESGSDLLTADNIHPRALLLAAKQFWGERDFQSDEPVFSPNEDRQPVFTGATVEKGEPGDANLARRASRLVVFSNPNLISPEGNTPKPNADLMLAALNWTIAREEMIGITPRQPSAFALSISPTQLGLLQTLIAFVLPLGALLLGSGVWLARRN